MVKINDVARHAGVAPSTVSYVLSGKRTISEQTRERVMRSIHALGYHPHAGARSLATNRTNVIALVIPLRTGMNVPVIMQFVLAVVTEARSRDQDVLLLTQDEGVAGLRRVTSGSMVDALIVMDVEMFDPRVPVLRELRSPSVLIGIPAETEGLNCIDLDFNAAGAACLDHLADLGHRNVALIGSPPDVYRRETGFAARTLSGFKEAATRRRVRVVTRPAETDEALDVEAWLHLQHPDVTGIVVHNEALLEPLVRVFQKEGRRVPEDISIVAICPENLATSTHPGLTSVNIPTAEIGAAAVQVLMSRLEMPDLMRVTRLFPAQLTVRESTAPPPGK